MLEETIDDKTIMSTLLLMDHMGFFKNTCTSKYHIKHYEKRHAKHN